jgi:hypothetical protein
MLVHVIRTRRTKLYEQLHNCVLDAPVMRTMERIEQPSTIAETICARLGVSSLFMLQL